MVWLADSLSITAVECGQPFNYISMHRVLDLGRFSDDFRYKVLKPMFINFVLATHIFDMPAALFARYLEFFNIESATPCRLGSKGPDASMRT